MPRIEPPRDRFLLNKTQPQSIFINETTPEGNATKLYTVVADYGWAEILIATDCYYHIANDIAWAIGTVLKIPYEVVDK